MSSVLDILKTRVSERNETLYLQCQPITTAPPGDMPEIKEIVDKYWSGKIIIRKNNNSVSVTEWFSIPYQSIRLSTGQPVNGPCVFMLEELPTDKQRELFNDTSLVFTIDRQNDKDVFRWVNNR